MKFALFLLLLAGGYAYTMLALADSLFARTNDLHTTYNHVATTADQWSQGDTSGSFTPSR